MTRAEDRVYVAAFNNKLDNLQVSIFTAGGAAARTPPRRLPAVTTPLPRP